MDTHKTVNTNTNFDRVIYWKKRMIDRLSSTEGQWGIYRREIINNAQHINLNTKKIKEALLNIEAAFGELYGAIETAQVNKE